MTAARYEFARSVRADLAKADNYRAVGGLPLQIEPKNLLDQALGFGCRNWSERFSLFLLAIFP
jgi:hypothetical protein